MNQVQVTASLIGMAYVLQQDHRCNEESCLWNLLNGRLDSSLVHLKSLFSTTFPHWNALCILWFIPEYYPGYTSNLSFYKQLFSDLSVCMTACDEGVVVLADWDAFQKIQSTLEVQLQKQHCSIGVGCAATTVEGLKRSYALARESDHFARQNDRWGLAFYQDYRLHSLLSFIPDSQLKTFLAENPLNVIIQWDQRYNTEYMNTIRAFLHCNGNIKQTASLLHVHKNTVFYRISKLREELGFDLSKSATVSLLTCFLILKEQQESNPEEI